MSTLDKVRKLGFKRWYERQLIEGHAWFVTCFGCAIVFAASLETIARPWSTVRDFVLSLAAFGALIVGIVALRRYHAVLEAAERVGEAAVCAECKRYAAFTIIDGPTPITTDGARGMALRVRCRHCAHEWALRSE